MALTTLGTGWGPLLECAIAQVSVPVRDRIGSYLDEVVVWNAKTDLTAARSPEELVDLSAADAAVIARASTADGPGTWIDVGSGAGAPGLVLALMASPDAPLAMRLVEPRDRRVAFLRSCIGKFGLSGTHVERSRSDRLPDRGWDVAVSRATLPPEEWLREGARLARRAVWVLLAREEPPSLPGWAIDADLRYEWPLTGASRRAVRYVRVKPV